MDHLPESVVKALEGAIDPHSQHLIETHAQTFFIALTAFSFVLSFITKSVIIGLEAFTAGFVVLLLVVIPAWPYLKRHPIQFLPVRKNKNKMS